MIKMCYPFASYQTVRVALIIFGILCVKWDTKEALCVQENGMVEEVEREEIGTWNEKNIVWIKMLV